MSKGGPRGWDFAVWLAACTGGGWFGAVEHNYARGTWWLALGILTLVGRRLQREVRDDA